MRTLISRWIIHDVRADKDRILDLPDGTVFSSRKERFIVLEGPRRDWRQQEDLLTKLLTASGQRAFCTYSAWWPGAGASIVMVRDLLRTGDVTSRGHSLVASSQHEGFIATVLEARQRAGGDSSGLWSVGSTLGATTHNERLLNIAGVDDSPISVAASQAAIVGCAPCMEDGFDMILCRFSKETAPLIDRLADELDAVEA